MKTRLIMESHAGEEASFDLASGRYTLGRTAPCGLVLANPTVSRRHCELEVSNFGVVVRDLGSTNGTLVDGQAVQMAELRDGQRLALGVVCLRVNLPPIEIAIPDLTVDAIPQAVFLPDGSPACLYHPGCAAMRRCVRCGFSFCEDCTRHLGLAGRAARHFCPSCSGACYWIGPVREPQRKSRARRLLDTIKLALDFRSPGKHAAKHGAKQT